MPHGTLVKIVSQNLVAYPWVNVDQVNYFMRKLKKAAACSPFCEAKDLQPTVKDMTLSSLTADDLVKVDDASVQNLTASDEEEVVPKSTGGHPKGTTNACYVDLQECIMLTKNEAANEYSWVRSEAK